MLEACPKIISTCFAASAMPFQYNEYFQELQDFFSLNHARSAYSASVSGSAFSG